MHKATQRAAAQFIYTTTLRRWFPHRCSEGCQCIVPLQFVCNQGNHS